jgi:hypothetical protein
MGTDGGVDESVVQPAADEGEVPSLAAGFSFGGRSGGGEWVGGGVSPLSSQTESESKREKPTFKPRLRFVPRFLLALPHYGRLRYHTDNASIMVRWEGLCQDTRRQ